MHSLNIFCKYLLRHPLHRTEIVRWPFEQSKIGPISQRSLKSNKKAISVGDSCPLVDLWAISPLRLKNLAFIERSLRDHWEIDEIVESSLSIHWAFVEQSLRDRFHWWSLRDCFGLSQNFEETVATMEVIGRSLTNHWEILAIAGCSLKDSFVERSGHFFIVLSDRHPCVKGVYVFGYAQWGNEF